MGHISSGGLLKLLGGQDAMQDGYTVPSTEYRQLCRREAIRSDEKLIENCAPGIPPTQSAGF